MKEELKKFVEQVKADVTAFKAQFSVQEEVETTEEVVEVEATEEVAEVEVELSEVEVELMEEEEVPAEDAAPENVEAPEEEFVTAEMLAEAVSGMQAQIDEIQAAIADVAELSVQMSSQVQKLSKAPAADRISTEEKFTSQEEEKENGVYNSLLKRVKQKKNN